ncbi:MAG: KEOPS complex N(6)-L-threonylcarbamoyladenine synthase Kae1 [Candidatus Diapherotrites archaeon]
MLSRPFPAYERANYGTRHRKYCTLKNAQNLGRNTFGVGIASDRPGCKILANERDSVTTSSGGMIPAELAKHHFRVANQVVRSAMQKAGASWKDIDVICFAQGPGIGGALKVGALFARVLAQKYKKPLLGVNHAVAHIEIGKALTLVKDPIVVYASGGNTQVIGLQEKVYRVFGETLDIGIGNLFDSFGRELGLGFPAGPKLDEMYFEGKKLIELPYTVKGMDLAFSGLLTSAKKLVGKERAEDLAYSVLHTSLCELTEVVERALAHTGKEAVLVVGGVAASKAFAQMLNEMGKERGVKIAIPPKEAVMDNGAMIAWLGLLMREAGVRQKMEETKINQRFRVDQVEVRWQQVWEKKRKRLLQ